MTSYQLQRQLGAHLGHIPAAAMASRTIPVENLSSIKILFVVLANLAHGVLAQGTTAEPRIGYQNQVNRAISCFLLLSSPNSCRNLKKAGGQAALSLKLLRCSDLHARWSFRRCLCCSPPRRHRPRHMCCQVSGTWLFSILFTCVVITVILKVVYFRLKSGVRKAELRGPSRQVRL